MRLFRNLTIMVIAAAGLAACGTPSGPDGSTTAAAPPPSSTTAPSSAAARPVSCETDFLRTLSVREKIAQLLMVGVKDAADARRAVQQFGVGGVFVGSWTDKAIFSGGALKQVSAQGKVPLMVSVDEEGGRVSRVPGANLVSARQLAKTKTVEQARAEGKRVGKLMASMGITVDFAPDADVSAQPDDSVIGDRSYSDDPAVVTKYSKAFAAGLRDGGVYPVFKHFPGHGRSSGDSHQGGVSVPPLSELQKRDLVPFRAAAQEDAGMMVGHLTVPGLTEKGLPTSLSANTMRLLRDGVGYGAAPFAGPIFTDDLSGMKAITNDFTVPQAVTKALVAGADVALWISTDQLGAAVSEVEAAVKAGKLPLQRLDASVLRVARAKHAVRC
ncbi:MULTISPECIES: glycoside hydrolase family 3 N-terminal domain-containing protein [Tsukamurella]|uniref:beta-N-acetylhexosaminidase n=1 Tax=Tsukamurella strandjordii TaxID=147577 RepID=A0AA90N7K7_9ACTN|nr:MULTISPECIES: glycoside hydrolase family 3 N-terminal domain-containing protein [Tsukamurella]MDP0397036.1 glycoside hydrolase family 3 N-terminal domain-containing protein [Tsukamurella strandjordii]